MTTLNETLWVDRQVADVFAYLSDFSTTAEWDPGVKSASKLTPGPVAPGTEFLVTCALPLGSIDLRYEVTALHPPERLQLRGTSRYFDIEDSIEFRPEDGGTRINYRAAFSFRPWVKPLAARLQGGLKRMGERAMAGLGRALEDNYTPPAGIAGNNSVGSVIGSLPRFTRLGYTRGRKHWQPLSANLSGRHVVITGASSGLGLATAQALARRNATLTLVVRDRTRGERVRAALRGETGNDNIALEVADLSLLAEVDALIDRLSSPGDPIDVLINNAGALFNQREVTAEGIEQSCALLLLSPYRLTLGLKPLLQAAEDGARVINVVSGGMYTQRLDLRALVSRSDDDYSGAVAYARAKRALMVITRYWAAQWRADEIRVNAMHPGWADTPGVRRALPTFHALTRFVLRNPEEGADTVVWLAAATEAGRITGELFLDREPQPLHLFSATRETASERHALYRFLEAYAPGTAASA